MTVTTLGRSDGVIAMDRTARPTPSRYTLLPCVVLASLDRVELHGVARLHEKRRVAKRIERLDRRAADQLPAAGGFRRIDTGLDAGDADRPGRHTHARRR